ncbi:Uncharacterized protein TCM_024577 [Theobroma cacao]|uniref:Uncharacterized protein n=1 Tax=Theobroma cacao TaxID=3641 RepID=A0A061EVV3_THECC|nr:Uncharacterized protein TCM_024577 [Theobroma cacao]
MPLKAFRISCIFGIRVNFPTMKYLKGYARAFISSSKKDTIGRSLYQNGSRFAGIIGGLSPAATLKNDFFCVRKKTNGWFGKSMFFKPPLTNDCKSLVCVALCVVPHYMGKGKPLYWDGMGRSDGLPVAILSVLGSKGKC